MSNKLYKGDEPKLRTDKSMAVFVGWACLMLMCFLSVMWYSVSHMEVIGPYDTDIATVSNATMSNALGEDWAIGFLTLDGEGIASHPFMSTAEITLEYTVDPPSKFTALPLALRGDANEEGDHLVVHDWLLFPYEEGTTGAADAYMTCIESGWQENFEDLWSEVYDVLNDVKEPEPIDASILQEILSSVYQNEEFGDLRDIATDCLVLVKDINNNGPLEEYNVRAQDLYNMFYSWLTSFSVDMLKSESD